MKREPAPIVADSDTEYGNSLDSVDAALIAEIQALLQSGKPITAIQLYKEKADVGLCEAKHAVERLIDQMFSLDALST